MSFCSLGHWCQVNIALVHAIINSSIPSTSFTPTCANTIPAYISAHLDNVHSLGEHKFLADAKDWNGPRWKTKSTFFLFKRAERCGGALDLEAPYLPLQKSILDKRALHHLISLLPRGGRKVIQSMAASLMSPCMPTQWSWSGTTPSSSPYLLIRDN